jgi:hypothetical protein
MAWPRRQLAVAHRPQFAAKRLLGHADLKLLPQPLAKVDDTPAHDAVDSRDRSSLDGFCQGRTMSVIEPRVLNFSTQSRMICSVTPPICAASVRVAPS